MLDFLRFPVGKSRGRRYPEPEHPYRSPFQRDRDRIVHARAFRRLEAKTQVFTPRLSDHFRNRLTHTIEVAQIARTVAAALGLDEDLTEALALVHDIGHPPFAHAGEEELDRQVRRFSESFDHNLHALRIVESFEQRYARFPGLNLTFEVREGIVKHSRDLERAESGPLAEYLPGMKPPLEAQLIDLADEVAYNTADLDDGFAALMFTADEISAEVEAFAEIHETTQTQFPGASEREKFQESLRQLIDLLVSGLMDGTLGSVRQAGVESVEDIRQFPKRLASFTVEAGQASLQLKQFLYRQVYSTRPLAEERTRAAAQVANLFQFFLESPQKLPESYRNQAAQEPLHRVICDYIAGMTDGYFLRVFEQMLEPGQ